MMMVVMLTSGHWPQTGPSPLYALSCLTFTTYKIDLIITPYFTV